MNLGGRGGRGEVWELWMGTGETEGGCGEGFGGAGGEERDMDTIPALCGHSIESVIGFRDESRYWKLHWHSRLFTTLYVHIHCVTTTPAGSTPVMQ